MNAMSFPVPGNGYSVREYLGGGRWKQAYRASTPYRLADVALLFFRDDDTPADFVAKDVGNLIRTATNHPYASYITEFYGTGRDASGRLFIVEELLDRPLESLGRIDDIVLFVRIARDLSRGIVCLHDSGLVHRDLKLDNCGLDHQRRGKIFDLGSLTSEGGSVKGTVFTRSPELFGKCETMQCTTASDVWALGATLFALRTGDYPFVHRSEVEQRKLINSEVRSGIIAPEMGQARKEEMDLAVGNRIAAADAAEKLQAKIHQCLRGRPEELLRAMLEFDPKNRPSAAACDAGFSEIAREQVLSVVEEPQAPAKWEKIKMHLISAERKELVLTRKQIERTIAEYETDKPDDKDREIEILLKKIKEN